MPEILLGSLPLLESMASEILRDVSKAQFRAATESLTVGQIRYQRCKISRKTRAMNAMLRRIAAAAAEDSPAPPEDAAVAALHSPPPGLCFAEPPSTEPS